MKDEELVKQGKEKWWDNPIASEGTSAQGNYAQGYKDGYLAGLHEGQEENNKLLDVINNQDVKIADLEKKLEKMKCCENCNEWYRLPTGQKDCAETNCEKLSHWTMRIKE